MRKPMSSLKSSSPRYEERAMPEITSGFIHLCHVCHTINESEGEIHECVKCQAVFTIDATAAIVRTTGGASQEWDEDFSDEMPEGFEEMEEETLIEEQDQKDFHHNPLPFGRKKTPPLTGLKVQW